MLFFLVCELMSHPRRLTTSTRELEDFLNISVRMVNSPLFTSSKRGFREHNISTLLLVKSLNSHSEQRRLRRTNDRALTMTWNWQSNRRRVKEHNRRRRRATAHTNWMSSIVQPRWTRCEAIFAFEKWHHCWWFLFFSSSVKCLLCLCSDLHVTSPLWKWSRMDDEARREKTSDSAHRGKWRIYSYFFSIDITSNDRENGHPCRKMSLLTLQQMSILTIVTLTMLRMRSRRTWHENSKMFWNFIFCFASYRSVDSIECIAHMKHIIKQSKFKTHDVSRGSLFCRLICWIRLSHWINRVTSSPLSSPIRRTTNILFENLFLFHFHCHTRSTFISYLDLAFRWAVERREICIENCKLCRDKRQSNTRKNRKKLQGESRFIGSVMGRHGAVRLALFWSKLLFCSVHNSHCQVKDSCFAKQILCVAAKNKHTTKCDEKATRRWFEM